jgi:hypothetical protein
MTNAPIPTLGHAFAALDALPIAGQPGLDDAHPGIDFDALGRARRLLPHVWSEQIPFVRIAMTAEGGVVLGWQGPEVQFDLTIEPFAVYALRLDTPSKSAEWTRPTIEQTIAESRAALRLPPLSAPVAGEAPLVSRQVAA